MKSCNHCSNNNNRNNINNNNNNNNCRSNKVQKSVLLVRQLFIIISVVTIYSYTSLIGSVLEIITTTNTKHSLFSSTNWMIFSTTTSNNIVPIKKLKTAFTLPSVVAASTYISSTTQPTTRRRVTPLLSRSTSTTFQSNKNNNIYKHSIVGWNIRPLGTTTTGATTNHLQARSNTLAVSLLSSSSSSSSSVFSLQTKRMMASSTTTLNHANDDTIEKEKERVIKDALLNCPTIKLRNGMNHPIIGFGTYKVGYIPASASSAVSTASTSSASGVSGGVERTASECVLDAIQIGYRFLECAEFYGNEQQVGIAIQQSGIPRDEFFLCSKVWTTTIEKGEHAIRTQLYKTLSDLQTSYIDLYLIHWPVPIHHINAYKTLLQLRNEGLIRGIGVSNYSYEDYIELKDALQLSNDDLPLVNQIEINPFLYRKNTITKFQQDNIVLQSYRSLRDGKVMDHPILKEISSHYTNKSVAQILGRWCIEHSFIYIPKSIHTKRMIENANVLVDFTLSKDDMTLLDTTLTTMDALETFQSLYRKCVNRDTTKDGTMENVKMNITID